MALLAFNMTTSPLTLAASIAGTTVVLPASTGTGVRGPAVNVTSELKGLTGPNYTSLQVQVTAGHVQYEWTSGQAEYSIGSLQVVGAAGPVTGTLGSQSMVAYSALVVGTTPAGGASVTVDTGYVPPSGSMAQITGWFSAIDRTGTKSHIGSYELAVANYAGTPALAGSAVTAGSAGDASLVAATPLTFDCGGVGGAVRITFVPFASYANSIDWIVQLNALAN